LPATAPQPAAERFVFNKLKNLSIHICFNEFIW
jgi:hypothetical protein